MTPESLVEELVTSVADARAAGGFDASALDTLVWSVIDVAETDSLGALEECSEPWSAT